MGDRGTEGGPRDERGEGPRSDGIHPKRENRGAGPSDRHGCSGSPVARVGEENKSTRPDWPAACPDRAQSCRAHPDGQPAAHLDGQARRMPLAQAGPHFSAPCWPWFHASHPTWANNHPGRSPSRTHDGLNGLARSIRSDQVKPSRDSKNFDFGVFYNGNPRRPRPRNPHGGERGRLCWKRLPSEAIFTVQHACQPRLGLLAMDTLTAAWG